MSDQLSILSEARTWPEKVVADWREFLSGLWRVPEGVIPAVCSADIFPKVKVFTHNGVILNNSGGSFSGPVAAAGNCYPLLPVDESRSRFGVENHALIGRTEQTLMQTEGL